MNDLAKETGQDKSQETRHQNEECDFLKALQSLAVSLLDKCRKASEPLYHLLRRKQMGEWMTE